ncbi:MAG TPA: SCO family protein [Stellaceae bacterium]|jgi:protein SCO1/2|nr:SCO family protein [Stellaceae bacterium]
MKPAAIAGLALLIAATMPATAQQSSFTTGQLADLSFHQHPGATLPLDTALADEAGRTVTLGSFFIDRPVIVVLDYLHCKTLCGFVLDDLVRTTAQVPLTPGRDYDVVAISIDPHDTPADSRAAREQFLVRTAHPGGWHFLTGSDASVRQIADAIGFPYLYDAGAGQYAHPAGITIASPDGRIARYLLGIDYPPLDLRLALTEAARGAISSPATALLLLCYCYDPATGRYSAQINTVLRILGGATVLGIGFMVLRLSGVSLRKS